MRRTPHYYVQVSKALSPTAWFATSRGVRDRLQSQGYEMHEFNDNTDSDRRWREQAGALDWFEGQIVFPADNRWKRYLVDAFDAEGATVVAARLDDENYKVEQQTH